MSVSGDVHVSEDVCGMGDVPGECVLGGEGGRVGKEGEVGRRERWEGGRGVS